jgi:GT2 family glycosyltransferase
VREDWITVGWHAMSEDHEAIITGQVLAGGGAPERVPSIRILETARDFTGEIHLGVLFAGNMACPRKAVLELGGFDERIVPAAEDNDFCYRWLREGRPLRHVPELVVSHWDWRTPQELERHYVGYYRGQGRVYAKHLRAGDLRVLRFLAGDCYQAVRSLVSGWIKRTPRSADSRRGAIQGLPAGLLAGWREFRGERGGGI